MKAILKIRLTSWLVWMVWMSAAQASEIPDYPFIHAIGNAKVFVQPDIGEISFEVVITDSDSDQAAEQLMAINDDILKLLADQNIPASDISIYQLEKKQRPQDSSGSAGSPTGISYEIKQGMQIEVRDMNKWQNLTAPLLSKNHLGNFSTDFDRTDRKEIKDGLMLEAVRDAQRKGALMAEAFGKHLGPVVAVSSERLRDMGFAFGMIKGDGYDNDERRNNAVRSYVAPQAIMIMQSVDTVFRIR
jgi:uncharacterized protein YggE